MDVQSDDRAFDELTPLAADKARLDWLEARQRPNRSGDSLCLWMLPGRRGLPDDFNVQLDDEGTEEKAEILGSGPNLRAAIDQAMAGEIRSIVQVAFEDGKECAALEWHEERRLLLAVLDVLHEQHYGSACADGVECRNPLCQRVAAYDAYTAARKGSSDVHRPTRIGE